MTPDPVNGKEEVSITAPGGIAMSARGWLTPLLFLMVVGFVVSAWAAKVQHDNMENQVSRMADAIEVSNWLLSMPQDKRPRLLRPFSANRFIEAESR